MHLGVGIGAQVGEDDELRRVDARLAGLALMAGCVLATLGFIGISLVEGTGDPAYTDPLWQPLCGVLLADSGFVVLGLPAILAVHGQHSRTLTAPRPGPSSGQGDAARRRPGVCWGFAAEPARTEDMVAAPSAARNATFRADLRDELGRLVRWPPSDALLTIAVNALLVCGGWLLLPPAAKAWLFTLQGPLAFAVVLAAWMLADTPSTNMLGDDAERALEAVPNPARLRRLLRVKAAALACVIGPVTALVCVAIALFDGHPAAGLAVAVVLLVLPLGVAPLAAWLGVRWPYHPRRLAWRWAHRRPWRRTARWGAIVVAPYGVVPAIALALMAPGIAAGVAIGKRGADGRLSGWSLAAPVVISCLLSAASFLLGPRGTTALVARREPALSAYLRDPDLG